MYISTCIKYLLQQIFGDVRLNQSSKNNANYITV